MCYDVRRATGKRDAKEELFMQHLTLRSSVAVLLARRKGREVVVAVSIRHLSLSLRDAQPSPHSLVEGDRYGPSGGVAVLLEVGDDLTTSEARSAEGAGCFVALEWRS